MKKIFILIILVTTPFLLIAQDFCGQIKYAITYTKNRNGKDVTDKTKDIKRIDFYICGNKFKAFTDGVLSEIYIGDSNVYIQVNDHTKKVIYTKADSSYGQSPPNYIKVSNVEYKNNSYGAIKEVFNKSSLTILYSDDVKINAHEFSSLELYHLNKFFAATNGSLRLISFYEDKRLTTKTEAIEINQLELTDDDFKIPDEYGLSDLILEKIKDYNNK